MAASTSPPSMRGRLRSRRDKVGQRFAGVDALVAQVGKGFNAVQRAATRLSGKPDGQADVSGCPPQKYPDGAIPHGGSSRSVV